MSFDSMFDRYAIRADFGGKPELRHRVPSFMGS